LLCGPEPDGRGLESTGGLPRPAGLGVRAVWLLIALAGLAALVGDVRALT